MRRLLLIAVALLVAACGSGGGSSSPEPSEPDSTTTTTTASTTTTTTTEGDVLPGERVDLYPYEDAHLVVVGVPAAGSLPVRSGPGDDFDVLTDLGSLRTGVVATGHNRSLAGRGFWSEVRVEDTTGWAETGHLAQLGRLQDLTDEVVGGPEVPAAETLSALGLDVAASRASQEPPSELTVIDGPTVYEATPDEPGAGEIMIDLIGLGDDAQAGERLRMTARLLPDGETFVLQTLEANALCARGVTADGLCV